VIWAAKHDPATTTTFEVQHPIKPAKIRAMRLDNQEQVIPGSDLSFNY
jgi:hypothetical protein